MKQARAKAAWMLPQAATPHRQTPNIGWPAIPTLRGMTLPSTLCSRRPSPGLATSPTPSRC